MKVRTKFWFDFVRETKGMFNLFYKGGFVKEDQNLTVKQKGFIFVSYVCIHNPSTE